ncbi:dephospho-CoA kinase [Microaerobacter geothermalis]|uniref:dephospho-CoA kinase n=1 Tax=Microaerobacter geothermalis TaxID=674972 RepID=UPI001EEBE915|nr:dephospho-CoA kinase [Microaerobacter geothermalis]MCF6092971.1 dephospho-CoA kinase [Microaerobacter geothermalis]
MVIGLTGGIASGKSTVSAMLRHRGAIIVDADLIAREVVKKGNPAWEKIIQHFGQEVLDVNHEIERKRLGEIIFSDPEKRRILNGIVHPYVREEMEKQKKEGQAQGKLVVLDIPLLIESNLFHMVDQVVLVYVPKSVQLVRLMERNQLSEEEALARIHSQMPLDEKKKWADFIIYNDGSKEETERQIDHLLFQLFGGAKEFAKDSK